MSNQAKGMLLTALGVVILSPDSALTRLIGLDTFSMAFWRHVGFGAVMIALSLAWRGRGIVAEFRSSGWLGWAVVACLAVTQFSFTAAIVLTNPAHALVLVSSSPLFGAIASRVLLGERLGAATAIAIAVGLTGVAITAFAGLDGEAEANWRGDLFALVVAVAMGLGFTLIRKAKLVNAWPHLSIAATINVAWIGVLAPVSLPDAQAVPWLMLLALVVLPAAFALISTGPRYITAPEVSLILLLEVPLGTLLVWWAVGLAPSPLAIVGGTILVAALGSHALWRLRYPNGVQKSLAIPLTSQSP